MPRLDRQRGWDATGTSGVAGEIIPAPKGTSMLLELILTATCLMDAGTYLPPDGWTITQVQFKGHWHPMMAPITENTVTLHRTVQIGEQVQAPKGCTLTSEAKETKEPPKKDCLAPWPDAQGRLVFIECPPGSERKE
jgi:hypothetical protein